MKLLDNTFLPAEGVYFPQILSDVKKNPNVLQPIYEAFTNSLESIYLKSEPNKNNLITVKHYLNKNLHSLEFDKIIIADTGKGFDDLEFKRLLTYKDSRKGFNNRGSGRIQLIHFFDNVEYSSVFSSKQIFKQRNFKLSKSNNFIIQNNTITFLKFTKEADSKIHNTGSSVLLSNLLDKSDESHYSLQIEDLKKSLLNHYMLNFCLNRNNLPSIVLEQYINNEFVRRVNISDQDIPEIDKTFSFPVNYNWLAIDADEIKKLDENEEFKITSFKIPKDSLPDNSIKLTSKDEIVNLEKHNIDLKIIASKDHVDGNRFLFLISSKYLDDRDSDLRGDLKIPTRDDFKKNIEVFSSKEIFIDDIEESANLSILSNYNEIQQKVDEKITKIEELKSMFLLNDEFLKAISISLNDTEEKILEKVYIEESKQVAKADSRIKQHIEQLNNLDPLSKTYENEFDDYINRLVKEIPLQNRKALTHYVARRKLVINLFDKILNRQLNVQNDGSRKKDEALIHNLIFKQHSDKPDASDLWLLDEDFILFDGSSENELGNITIKGKKIFKDDLELSEEEIEFRDSLDEKRYQKRPDILMFPDEAKCIIIEFKSPDVNVSDYINQIQNYATLIRNFTKEEYQFDTFYGYLLGEKINTFDIQAKDPDFKEAHKFDYLFRPSKTVAGLFSGRSNGNIYMEIMKYSTLYERAKNRNDVFIRKLTQGMNGKD